MKKLFLLCTMLLTLAVGLAQAALPGWSLEDGVLIVRQNYEYESASEYPWYGSRDQITSVTFAEDVTTIGKFAFNDCDALESVTIPASVTQMGWSVFSGCDNLSTIFCEVESEPNTWDSAWRLLNDDTEDNFPVLWDCNNCSFENGVLTINADYELGNNPYPWVSLGSLITSVMFGEDVTVIGESAFDRDYGDYSNLASVDLGNVTTIGDYAFYHCNSLESITISGSVTEIGYGAFCLCQNLSTVDFGDDAQLATIGTEAFYNCDALGSITIPASVTEMGENVFGACDNLSIIVCEEGSPIEDWDYNWNYNDETEKHFTVLCGGALTVMEDYDLGNAYDYPWVAYASQITSVTFTENVTTIGASAFDCEYGDYSNLKSVDLGNVTTIGVYAFYNCDALESITIPASVTEIGEVAFTYCGSLASVTFSEDAQLTTIGSGAFEGCENLESITIPEKVTEMGDFVFNGCDNLAIILCEAESKPEGWGMFWNGDGIPALFDSNNCGFEDGVLTIKKDYIFDEPYSDNYPWHSLRSQITSVVFDDNNGEVTFTSIGNNAFLDCEKLESVTIPASVTEIGAGAFAYCESLETITFSEDAQLTTISNSAFFGCNALTSITIPASVTEIGGHAFRECYALESIAIPASVTKIGVEAFENCYDLKTVAFSEGAKLETIGDYAFYDCDALESITIPASVTEMGENVFGACDNLAIILCEEGSQIEDWDYDWNYNDETEKFFTVLCGGLLTVVDNYDFEDEEDYPWYEFRDQIKGVTFSDDVTTIGNYAFGDCDALISITIPASVTGIGEYIFDGCDILETIFCEIDKQPDDWNYYWRGGSDATVLWDCANWSLDENGLLTVKKDYEDYDYYEDYPWYKLKDQITGVTFSDDVTTVGKYAFFDYDNLESITIPASVTEIGVEAFEYCENLATVTFSEDAQLKTIGAYAFSDCDVLESITIPELVNEMGGNVFDDCDKLKTIFCEAPKKPEGWNEDWNYDAENGIRIPTLFDINNCSFEEGVLTVKKDYDLEDAKDYPWYEFNDQIKGVTFSDDVTTIGKYAFYEYSLDSVAIPASVTEIGYAAFGYCDYLATVTFSDESSLETIGEYAFYSCALDSIAIPATVTEIEDNAFGYCGNLAIVNFGENAQLGTIGYQAFSGCVALESIAIPASVTEIGDNAFGYCGSLEIVTFSDDAQLEIVGYQAFYDCDALKSITIPASVQTIDEEAFYDCGALTSVIFNEDAQLETIGDYAFENCNNVVTIEVPSTVSGIGGNAFGGIKNVVYYGNAGSRYETWGAWVRNGYIEDGFLYSDDTKTRLVAYIGDGGEVTIPETVVTIGDEAFVGCKGLTSVIIPESVEAIGNEAFNRCSNLETVDFSNATGLTTINDGAFMKCTSLESVLLPENLTHIGRNAFNGCSSLAEVSIPDGILTVREDAFANCNSGLFTEEYNFYYLGNENNPYLVLMGIVNPDDMEGRHVSDDIKLLAGGALENCTTYLRYDDVTGARYLTSESNDYLILAKVEGDYGYSFNVPEYTRFIADGAFAGRTNIPVINIPIGVEYVGEFAVSECSNNLVINCETGNPVLWDYDWNDKDDDEHTYTINWAVGGWDFDGGTGTLTVNTDVNLYDGNNYPWYGDRDEIEKVVFTENVNIIGEDAFYYYPKLSEVEFQATYEEDVVPIQTIGDRAFCYCYSLSNVDLSNAANLESIGSQAFRGCPLTKVVVPASVTKIGNYAFVENSVESGLALCEADGPSEGWDKNWTFLKPIWHYNNNTLTLTVNNASLGEVSTITVNGEDVYEVRPSAVYTYGDVVEFEAIAFSSEDDDESDENIFVRWSDGDVNAQRTITIEGDSTLQAVFASASQLHTVSLFVEVEGTGTVEGASRYISGDEVTIKASAAKHYHFVRWSDNGEGYTDAEREITIGDEDIELTAIFAIDQHKVTLAVEGDGNVTGDGTYDYGFGNVIYAYPADGWYFAQWIEDESTFNVNSNANVYVDGDRSITAVFKQVQPLKVGENTVEAYGSKTDNCVFMPAISGPYTFSAPSDANSYATYLYLLDADKNVLVESENYYYEDLNFDLEAGQVYYIGAGNGNDAIDDNMKVYVYAPVSVTAQGEGGTVEGTGYYAYMSWPEIKATPGEGMFFVKWDNGIENSTTEISAEKDTVITAEFHAIHQVAEGDNTIVGFYNGVGANINCVFTPSTTGTYVIFVESDDVINSTMYNSSLEKISSYNGYGFRCSNYVVGGQTYYIRAAYYDYGNAGKEMNLVIKAPVTVNAVAVDNGSVEGARTYTYGTTVTLTANADEGYKFYRWSDGSTENPYKFTAEEDVDLQAEFIDENLNVYTVTATANNSDWGTVEGGTAYIENETAELTATAAEHYHFVEWNDGEKANPRYVEVTEDLEFEAIFGIDTFNLSVIAENGVVIEGEGDYAWGEQARVSVSHENHYHFVGWKDQEGEGETRYIIVESDTVLTALFEIDQFTVEATADNGATVSGTGTYAYGADAKLTVVPAVGYHFDRWSDDAEEPNPRTVYCVDRDTAFMAYTAINTYEVTAEGVQNGSVTNLGTYSHGTEVEFEAVPAANYKFYRWSAGNMTNPYKVKVTSNMNLTPEFIPADADIYTLTVEAGEGGSATGSGTYLKNEKTIITATADNGYHFTHWSTGSTANSYEYTVTGSTTVTAYFEINTVSLTVLAGANGTVSGSGKFDFGASAPVSATANEGYHFVRWSDGNTNAERTVTLNKDTELTAEFAINTYAVKASATNGKVSGTGTYNHGQKATLTATANDGYHFVQWSDGVDTETREVDVTSALSFTAEFAINSYTVSANADHGSVDGTGEYTHGAKAKLTAKANTGYHFTQWSDGETKAERVVVVTEDLEFTAEFEINTYTVRASGSNGTVEGAGTYKHGDEATLTANANTGYHFAQWSDGVETATRKAVVTSNMSFTAEFAINTYVISLDSMTNGTVDGAGTYDYGTSVRLTAKAAKGYHFVQWTDSVKTAVRSVDVTGNALFAAEFAPNNYELTLKGKNGIVDGAGTYVYNTEATISATANAGYTFSKWSDGSTENPRTIVVTENTKLTAKFVAIAYEVKVKASNGSISGATGTFEIGAIITLTAIPDSGYHFVRWSDGNTDNPRTVELTAELLKQVSVTGLNFTAIFEPDEVIPGPGPEPGTAVNDSEAEAVNIFAYGNTIVVENADSDIFVFDAMGRMIDRVAAEAGRTEIQVNGEGVYVVKTGNAAKRVMIQE